MQIRDLLVSAYAHYQDTCLSLYHAHHQTMSNTKTEKYENISSRDYVPRYLKISRAETMSRLMGREHPAPKPFMDASIYFISRKDPKKKDPKKRKKKIKKKKKRSEKNLKKQASQKGPAKLERKKERKRERRKEQAMT